MSTTLDEARYERTNKPLKYARERADRELGVTASETTEALARAVFREEIARSRAPVGEDAYMQAVAAGCYALDDAPTPPAKDTGETLPRWFIDHDGAMRSSPIGYYTEHYAASQRIADLEARLAVATGDLTNLKKASHTVEGLFWKKIRAIEDERDEARSSLETAERRIGELAAAMRTIKTAYQDAQYRPGDSPSVPVRIASLMIVLGNVLPAFTSVAALTPNAGTARSEDEEG